LLTINKYRSTTLHQRNEKEEKDGKSAAALIQVHAGFVDLAAQIAPLVRRQAATGTARIVALALAILLRLLSLLLLLLLILLLGAALLFVGAHVGVALAAVLRRQRKAFAPTRLVLLRIVAAVAAVLLGKCGAGAKDQSARQRTAKGDARNAHCLRCCLVVGERAIHWYSSSAMPI
jgi:hypothetical protein